MLRHHSVFDKIRLFITFFRDVKEPHSNVPSRPDTNPENGPFRRPSRKSFLAYSPLKKYYAQCDDKDDLISIGTIGLIKAINTYDPGKKVKLATYASRCIENEILMYLRSMRRRAAEVSLTEALESDEDGGGLSLMDVLAQEDDLDERLALAEQSAKLRKAVQAKLEPREALVISARYGLGGKPPQTQRETAKQLGISRSYISRIEKKALEKLKDYMGQ